MTQMNDCDVCHARPSTGAEQMPLMTVSAARCSECRREGLIPWQLLIEKTAQLKHEGVGSEFWANVVENNLTYIQATNEADITAVFLAEVEDRIQSWTGPGYRP